jgi:ribonuclease P protein subunit RPR2|tara:strand:- start:3826 stop:4143 length:318 start_codon:yes stop_codon:yes gene_type:complete
MKKQKRGKVKQSLKELARERIKTLFKHAETVSPEAGRKAVKRARDVGMKFRVHMPKDVKRKYCKKCDSFLKPGVNCIVRLNQKKQSHIVITCTKCGAVIRMPYKK